MARNYPGTERAAATINYWVLIYEMLARDTYDMPRNSSERWFVLLELGGGGYTATYILFFPPTHCSWSQNTAL